MYITYFLKGLDLEKLIKGADLCLNQAFFTVDEFTYFLNNASDAEWKNWQLPILNFTATAASNFSQAVVNCYEFANETYMFFVVRFAS
jgi:hypothetical protein